MLSKQQLQIKLIFELDDLLDEDGYTDEADKVWPKLPEGDLIKKWCADKANKTVNSENGERYKISNNPFGGFEEDCEFELDDYMDGEWNITFSLESTRLSDNEAISIHCSITFSDRRVKYFDATDRDTDNDIIIKWS